MNCKPGDLAIVVRSTQGFNVGKMVRCIELLPTGTDRVLRSWGPLWRIDRPLAYENLIGKKMEKYLAPDKALMPIRPDGEQDEIEERHAHSAGEQP